MNTRKDIKTTKNQENYKMNKTTYFKCMEVILFLFYKLFYLVNSHSGQFFSDHFQLEIN